MKKVFVILSVLAVILTAFISFLPATIGASLAFAGLVGSVQKSNKQLENYSKNFTSFTGDENSAYTGFNDDGLDFGGTAQSFMDKLTNNRIFTMILTNSLATREEVTLIPDYTWAPRLTGTRTNGAGVSSNIVVDGAIKTVGQVSLVGAGSPTNILDFLSYIAKRPTQCGMIRIAVDEDHTNQLDEQMIVGAANPFRSAGFETIPVQNSVLPNYFNQKVAIIKTPGLILGDEIQLSLAILAGAVVNISFYCGAAVSNYAALRSKMNKAAQTIEMVNAGQLALK